MASPPPQKKTGHGSIYSRQAPHISAPRYMKASRNHRPRFIGVGAENILNVEAGAHSGAEFFLQCPHLPVMRAHQDEGYTV